LILPRVIGLAVMSPLLTIVCNAIGIIGGGFVAESQLNVGLSLYYDSAIDALQANDFFLQLPKDVYSGLCKAFVFGIVVAIISCSAGLRATQGALGVGNATRKAVRDSIIAASRKSPAETRPWLTECRTAPSRPRSENVVAGSSGASTSTGASPEVTLQGRPSGWEPVGRRDQGVEGGESAASAHRSQGVAARPSMWKGGRLVTGEE